MDDEKPWEDEELLRELYWGEEMTMGEIGDKFGCSDSTIARKMRWFDIPRRSQSEANKLADTTPNSSPSRDKPWHDKELLRELYWEEEMSTTEIAEELGCSQPTISDWLIEFDIPRRDRFGEQEIIYEEIHDEDQMREWYVDGGYSTSEIANMVGCSAEQVRRRLVEIGVEMRRLSASETPAGFGTWQGYERWYSSHNGSPSTVSVHRLLAVCEFGCGAVSGKDVHHKNGVPWDNRPDNLEILSREEHMAHHMKERHERGEFDDREQTQLESVSTGDLP